jgi:hypothetical protein
MDRRKSLKVIALGSLSAGVLLDSCKTEDKKSTASEAGAKVKKPDRPPGRMREEIEHQEELDSKTFFTPHEIATITVLGDIIIPKDDVSGSASDAGVPSFIEFIVKEKPEFKVPMRGGLQWLDQQCLKKYSNVFEKCSSKQQIELVDQIAYPKKATAEMKQGASFFSLMRNLTASGFYTSEIGGKDIGYKGNTPNMWNGVPADVLKQYGLAYTEQELKECASYPE